jgi:hypothetical protein
LKLRTVGLLISGHGVVAGYVNTLMKLGVFGRRIISSLVERLSGFREDFLSFMEWGEWR